MEAVFNDAFNSIENDIFKVVFYPDRVYHANYLNATRSARYRYNVREVRTKLGIIVLKGQVYLDDRYLSNFIRIEYRSGRLVEMARENGRFLDQDLIAWVRLLPEDSNLTTEAQLKLEYCKWIDAYQVEIWENLEAPANGRHDYMILDMMGKDGCITRIPSFSRAMGTTNQSLKQVKQLELAFRENDIDSPLGYTINNHSWDNNFERSYQVPNTQHPSDHANTIGLGNYLIDFQRAYYIEGSKVAPVRYRNAMMNDSNPDRDQQNIIEMKWLLQRKLGSSLVFFHEVTIPPGKVEGTHRHIGTEEIYYITEGEGVAYMGENDDPALSDYPTEEIDVFGIGNINCKKLVVKPGDVIFTKSGGVHGIRNNSTSKTLRFVAFLYHTQ
jgi:mannose-6-phosphate isomerase-like protein (cupin superfamily)